MCLEMLVGKFFKADFLSSFAFTAGFFCLLLFQLTNEKWSVYLSIFFGLSLFVFFYFKNAFDLQQRCFIFLACLTYISSMLVNLNNGTFEGTIFLPHFLSSAGFAVFLFSGFVRPKFIDVVFFGLAFYALVSFFSVGHMEFAFVGSQNRVNTLFLFLFAFKCLAEYIRNGEVAVTGTTFAQIITIILFAIFAGHVMGLLCSILLYVLNLIYSSRHYWKITLLTVMILTICSIILYWNLILAGVLGNEFVFGNLEFISRFLEIRDEANIAHVTENVRLEIWGSFFRQLDIAGLIFGMPLKTELFLNETFHNSFLLLYCRGGLFGLTLSVFIILSCFRLLLRHPLLGSTFGILLLRGFTDTTFFAVGPFDFVIVAFVFLACKPLTSAKWNLDKNIVR